MSRNLSLVLAFALLVACANADSADTTTRTDWTSGATTTLGSSADTSTTQAASGATSSSALDELSEFFARSPSCTEDCGQGEVDAANIVTLDGLEYQVPAAGPDVLVLAGDRSVAVQLRISEEEPVVTNVAAVLTDYPVEIEATGILRIDGRIVEDLPSGEFIPLIDGAAIFREGDVHTLAWPGEGDERFRLDVTTTGNGLTVRSYLPPALAGLVAGLNGNGDGSALNDLTTRSGTTFEADAPAGALLDFVMSWSVGVDESLFGCEPGEYTSKNDLDSFEFGC